MGTVLYTLGAGGIDPFAVDVLHVLVAAGVVAVAFGLARLSPIPGYLIGGALIGPGVLGLVNNPGDLDVLGELAVMLLMFTVGLHLDASRLGTGLRTLLGAGLVSTLLSAALLGLVGLWFGLSWPVAAAIGLALAMSSTAVVLRAIQARRELSRSYGRLCFGVLIVQDILVLAVLALIPVLAAAEGVEAPADPQGLGFGVQVLIAVGLIGLTVVGLPRVFRWLTHRIGHDALLVTSTALALGSGVVAGWLGFSSALGAFVAGFVLASTPVKHHISGQLGPLRELFLAVFFTSVGLQLDLVAVGEIWWIVPVGAAILIACKVVSITFSSWLVGVPGSVALRSGLTLGQSGEFSLIVLAFAADAGLLGAGEQAGTVAVVIATLIVTPVLMAAGRRFGTLGGRLPSPPWLPDQADRHGATAGEHGDRDGGGDHGSSRDGASARVVVAGFGPTGRAVADEAGALGAAITIIELNTRTVEREASRGRSVVFGDVTNEEVLHSAGVQEADAVVLTIPDDEAAAEACRHIKRIASDVRIIARASTAMRAAWVRDAGADHVVIEESLAAEALAQDTVDRLAEWCGVRPVE